MSTQLNELAKDLKILSGRVDKIVASGKEKDATIEQLTAERDELKCKLAACSSSCDTPEAIQEQVDEAAAIVAKLPE